MIYFVVKDIYMNLKKRKHITPKKEDNFLMSLFLSSCFSFQTRADLVLVKDTIYPLQVFVEKC